MKKEFWGKIGVRAGMIVLLIVFAINLSAGIGNMECGYGEAVFTESDCPPPPQGYDRLSSSRVILSCPYPGEEDRLTCEYSTSRTYTTDTYSKYEKPLEIFSQLCRFDSIEAARDYFTTYGYNPVKLHWPKEKECEKSVLGVPFLEPGGPTQIVSVDCRQIIEDTGDRIGTEYTNTRYDENKPTGISYRIDKYILYKNYVLYLSTDTPCYVDLSEKDTAMFALNDLERSLKVVAQGDAREGDARDDDAREGDARDDDDCFIATAAYGTPINKNINVLREFRDDVLIENYLGETFVRIYYLSSPPIADVLTSSEWMRTATRVLLITPLVYVTKTLLNSTFQFILGACLVFGLYLTRKYKSIAIMKSIGLGFLTAVIISMTVFILGYTGHSSPICAIIAAHILPIIIPVSLGVVALSLIYSSFFRRLITYLL